MCAQKPQNVRSNGSSNIKIRNCHFNFFNFKILNNNFSNCAHMFGTKQKWKDLFYIQSYTY